MAMENSEIDQLRAIWRMVEPDQTTHGVEILIRLFDRYPETKSKFKRLTTSTPEEMRASARVRAHAGRVVTALGGIISSLEDNEMIDETIYLLGDSHKKRGIAGEDFEKFTNVFIDYLKSALGDKFPPAAEDAFKKLMGAFNKKIGQHLK